MIVYISDIITMGDYLYWLYEYVFFCLLWGKLKKKEITIPSDKYSISYLRKQVKLGDTIMRVPMISLEGILLIYPFKVEYNKPLKVIFFSYSSYNN